MGSEQFIIVPNKAMLKVQNISKSYGTEPVLNRISFVINRGERVGLVGPNGIGKSTLLRIISGIEKSDGGDVHLQKGARLVYMPQSEMRDASPNPLNGSNSKGNAWKLVSDLHLNHLDLKRDQTHNSGGEASKIKLAKALSEQADMYVLDEPTNNLDFPALRFLERAIANDSKSAFLVVSHDREFLDRIVSRIFEIDEFSHSIKEYTGNYSNYEREKKLGRELEFKRWEEQQKVVTRLEKSLEEKKLWVAKGKKGPKITDNNKLGRGSAKDRSKVHGGATKNIETRLKNIEIAQKPRDRWELHFDVSPLKRSGDIVMRAVGIEKELGRFHLGPLSFEMQYGERTAILGLNGTGKTTLLNLLMGNIVPDAGEIKRGSKVDVGFLEQIPVASDEKILDKFKCGTGLQETEARKLLHKFGLGEHDVYKPYTVLSPGERMRLEIAGFVARGVNLLVLDEPTNNLDLEAIYELEKVLSGFTGTLLVVTHDRRFLKNIGINRFYVLAGGSLKGVASLGAYEESFSDYRA